MSADHSSASPRRPWRARARGMCEQVHGFSNACMRVRLRLLPFVSACFKLRPGETFQAKVTLVSYK